MAVHISIELVREALPQDELEDLQDEVEGGLFGDAEGTLARLARLVSEDPEWVIFAAVSQVDEDEDDALEE